jgi:hypothetical protein
MGLYDDIRSIAGAGATRLAEWAARSDDDVSPSQMNDALVKAGMGLPEPTDEKPRALFHDPYSVMDWGGWRQRPSSLTYETLRQMSTSNTVIAAIINLRIHQVSAFCRPQQGKYDKGYRIILRDRRDQKKAMTPAEQKEADEIERLLEETGMLLPEERPADRDNFRSFSKKAVRDVLTYDQWCFEKIRDRGGRPSRFIALPSETIRPAVSDIEHMDPAEMRNRVSHVQVYENTVIAEFALDDLAWCVMNPRSDLRTNGFGFSPSEQIVRLVTSWLFGFDYNCLTGENLVATDRGLIPIEDLDGEHFRIHDGIQWQDARAYATEHKPVVRTKLWNGLSIRTSPEHRFRTIPRESETGSPEWRQQRALKQGDRVLVAYRSQDCQLDNDVFFVGRSFGNFKPTGAMVSDERFWEMIGFALGDGHWADPEGRSGLLSIFPHYARDAAQQRQFLKVCDQYGLNGKLVTVNKLVQRSDGEHGYPAIHIHNKGLLRWLMTLGFQPSKQGKRIGWRLFQAPAWIRAALLRGLFSADGTTRTHGTGYRTPSVHSSAAGLRQDVVQCLWSVGVAANEVGNGWDRCGEVSIQDTVRFNDRIGFLQNYKSEGIERANPDRWDVLHPATARRVCEALKAHTSWLDLSHQDRGMVSAVLTKGVGLSRPRAISMMNALRIELPEALHYCHVEVDVLDIEPVGSEPMYDVEVFDERHLFVANGMAVANTKFFTQGSAIKGLLNIKGAIPDRQMRAFRRMWYSQISSVQNAWKTPILNSDDIQWVSMHSANREMEYAAWMDWLTKLICAVYGIDPVEINFIFGGGGTGGGSAMFDRRPNQAEVVESKDKGLRPLLTHMEDHLNQHIVWELNEDFEFSWTGFDAKAEAAEREARMAEVTKLKTVNQVRAEMDEEPLPGKLGEIILDPTFLQWAMQQEAAAQEEEGGMPMEGGGAPPPGGGPPGAPPGAPEESDTGDDEEEDFLEGMHEHDDPNDHEDLLAASLGAFQETEELLRKSGWLDEAEQITDTEVHGG